MGFRERHSIPDLGIGVGFRPKHQTSVLDEGGAAQVDWFEIISENFMGPGGRPIANLERLTAARPVICHGVSLSVGGTANLDVEYLRRLRQVLERARPSWFSDHACFCRSGELDTHDLLPLPYTREAIDHVAERIKRVQGAMERPFAIENVSSYLSYEDSEMPEWEFIARLAEKADCGVLLDVNNVFVSAFNHDFDANAFVDAIDADRIVQIHLAGHTDKGTHLLDTHSDHVKDGVWKLYERVIARVGRVSTLIEWDDQIPEWNVLVAEADAARKHREAAADGAR